MNALPAGLMVEAVLKNCDIHCIPYYIWQKGNHGSGVLMVKINTLNGQAKLVAQERNFLSDRLEWVNIFDPDETVDEARADERILKAKEFDPDLWVIEVEDKQGRNPFIDDL